MRIYKTKHRQNPFGTIVRRAPVSGFFSFPSNYGTDPNVRPTLIINSQIIDMM